MNPSKFDKFTVPRLKQYLQDRGVTVSGYRRQFLLEIAVAVDRCQLPVDPDFRHVDSLSSVTDKLKAFGVGENPWKLSGFSDDLSNIPDFGLYDIFNYLLCSRADYDRRKLKAYKSFEDYRLFCDGHVECLEFNENGDSHICIFRSKVRPTQKAKTYLKKDVYEVWFLMGKTDGEVKLAFCECPGGSDGACRHVAASLYEVESYHDTVKSVTDGPVQWKKRARANDEPERVTTLSIRTVKYGDSNVSAFPELPDLRHPSDRQQPTVSEISSFTAALRKIDQNSGVLELLEDPDINHSDDESDYCDTMPANVGPVDRMLEYLPQLGDCTIDTVTLLTKFTNDIPYSKTDIDSIEQATLGQHCSANWHKLRKQMVTASNFKRVISRTEKVLANPNESCTALLNDLLNDSKDLDNVAAIAWGRKKEKTARIMYTRVERKNHIGLMVKPTGLFISSVNPFTGCSPDGIASCRCRTAHEKWLIEIKCPYSKRLLSPKEAALHCGVKNDGENWVLDNNHKYYAQIQGQCGIVGLNMCKLIIFTTKEIHVVCVPYDSEYFEYLSHVLRCFVTQFYIPRVLTDCVGNATV